MVHPSIFFPISLCRKSSVIIVILSLSSLILSPSSFVINAEYNFDQMAQVGDGNNRLNLDALRDSLVRQEDTIVFSLIERAKYPLNSRLYDDKIIKSSITDEGSSSTYVSLFDYFVKESEALQSKVGRYTSPEENAFFPDNLPSPLLPPLNTTPVLHSPGASININDRILNLYLKTLLPLITAKGDDGNYSVTAVTDLNCLQALSRRIHFGKFVAEVKFKDAPDDYIPAIRAKDRDTIMKLLTNETVEETVKKRVEKKAMIFGQDVELQDNNANKTENNYKVNPSVVYQLYGDWIIPLTKFVEVKYLLRRLD